MNKTKITETGRESIVVRKKVITLRENLLGNVEHRKAANRGEIKEARKKRKREKETLMRSYEEGSYGVGTKRRVVIPMLREYIHI